jgi:hypothetical protein
VIAVTACAAPGAASAATTHDLQGTWQVTGDAICVFPFTPQTWTITLMNPSSGAFSGTGSGGTSTFQISGTATGNAVELTTPYNEVLYSANYAGAISADSLSMSGAWDDLPNGCSGAWTATRPSAPGSPSPAPKKCKKGQKLKKGKCVKKKKRKQK